MVKLTTAARDALPKEDFALPGKKAFPIPDKSHAVNAKARASQAVNAGKMGSGTKAKIDAKANKMLDEGNAEEMPMKKNSSALSAGLRKKSSY